MQKIKLSLKIFLEAYRLNIPSLQSIDGKKKR